MFFDEIPVSFKDAKRLIKHFLETKVKSLIEDSNQPAMMMSSGVDSALITAMAAKYNPDIRVYTAEFPFDMESSDAMLIAHKLQVKHTIINIQPEDYLDIDKFFIPLIKHKKAPLHPNEIALAKCEQQAKDDGCDTIFCGEGADDIFGGYSKIFNFYKNHFLDEDRDKFLEVFLDFYRYFSIYDRNKIIQNRYLIDDLDLLKKYFPELGRVRLHNFGSYFIQKIHTPGLIKRGINAIEWNGLKPAFPYQDKELISYVNKIPMDFKVFGSVNKYILREIAKDYLPEEFAYIPKHPFPVPFDEWMKDISWDLNDELFISQNYNKLNGWKRWMVINLNMWWENGQ